MLEALFTDTQVDMQRGEKDNNSPKLMNYAPVDRNFTDGPDQRKDSEAYSSRQPTARLPVL